MGHIGDKHPVVIAYNGLASTYEGFAKIFTHDMNASASIWNGTAFEAVKSHLLREKYVDNKENHKLWYSLYVPVNITGYSSAYIRISDKAEHINDNASSDLYLRYLDGPSAHFGL